MDEKLTLANGTEIQGHLLDTGNVLFLYLYGISLAEAFGELIEPENTAEIAWERYGQTGSAEGFTHLYAISEEANGMISAGLKKQ